MQELKKSDFYFDLPQELIPVRDFWCWIKRQEKWSIVFSMIS